MAHDFDRVARRFYTTTGSPVGPGNLTMACRYRRSANEVAQTPGLLNTASSGTQRSVIYFSGSTVYMYSQMGGAQAQLTNALVTNSFRSIVGVEATTSRSIHVESASATATGTTNQAALVPITQAWVGSFVRPTPASGDCVDGDLADVAYWDVALTAPEIASFMAGISPRMIRPQSLKMWIPSIREVQDVRDARAITVTNGPLGVATHPRTYL